MSGCNGADNKLSNAEVDSSGKVQHALDSSSIMSKIAASSSQDREANDRLLSQKDFAFNDLGGDKSRFNLRGAHSG